MNPPSSTGGVLVVMVVLAALALLGLGARRKPGQKSGINYQSYFYIGLFLMFLGIAWGAVDRTSGVLGLIGLGLIFMTIGLANRDAWGRGKKWSDLSPVERRNRIFLLGGMVLLCLMLLTLQIMAK